MPANPTVQDIRTSGLDSLRQFNDLRFQQGVIDKVQN